MSIKIIVLLTDGEEYYISTNSTLSREHLEILYKNKGFDVNTVDTNSVMVYDEDISKILDIEIPESSTSIKVTEEGVLLALDIDKIDLLF